MFLSYFIVHLQHEIWHKPKVSAYIIDVSSIMTNIDDSLDQLREELSKSQPPNTENKCCETCTANLESTIRNYPSRNFNYIFGLNFLILVNSGKSMYIYYIHELVILYIKFM